MKTYLLSFFSSGHARTILAKKNIIISLFIKILSMIIMFIMVSLSIEYLGKEAYGLWILISSVLVWTDLFDFGLTNGLRNKLTESLASPTNCPQTDKNMISATYAMMLIISTIIFIVISMVIYSVNWKSLFNIEMFTNPEIQQLLLIIFLAFSINLFLKPVHAILNALQWPSVVLVFSLVAAILSLAALYLLFYIQIESKLLIYTTMMSFLPVLVMIIGSIVLFKNKLKRFRPNMKNIDFKLAKEVSTLGNAFFIIQLAGLIIAQTDNVIIASLFGTESVTDYNIVFRYFSLFIIGTAIMITPFWSAFTDAYIKEDFNWIRESINKLLLIISAFSIVVIIFVIYSDDVYKLWINENINIPIELSISMGIYVVIYSFSNVFIYFVNGTGHIKLQMYIGSAMAILNIPLSYLFASTLGYGVTGVVIATSICTAMPGIFSYVQYRKIMNASAKGIWKA